MSQQPVILQQTVVALPTTNRREYAAKTAIGLGITQIALGAASISLGIAAICVGCALGVIGTGIWCGIVFVVTGSIQLVSAKMKTTCTIIATMVLSIISASMSGCILLIISAISIAIESYDYYDANTVLVDSLLIIVAVTESVIAIVASCFCCKSVCCGKPSQTQYPMMYYVPPQQSSAPNQAGMATVQAAPNMYMYQPGMQVMTAFPGQQNLQMTSAQGQSNVVYPQPAMIHQPVIMQQPYTVTGQQSQQQQQQQPTQQLQQQVPQQLPQQLPNIPQQAPQQQTKENTVPQHEGAAANVTGTSPPPNYDYVYNDKMQLVEKESHS